MRPPAGPVPPPATRNPDAKKMGLSAAIALGLAGFAVAMTFVGRSRKAGPAITASPMPPPMVFPELPAVRMPDLAPVPPLLPLPAWERHLPSDLPPAVAGKADFRGQMLLQGYYVGRPLAGAVFAGAHLSQAQFEKADLTDADFRGADLSQAHLAGADVRRAKFDEASFGQTGFSTPDTAAVEGKTIVRNGITVPVPPPLLAPKNMGSASFRAARFSQVSLEGLNLAGANFEGAEFSQVELDGADLRRADLRGTRHSMTSFAKARLDGADLRGADLSSTRNLTAAQIATAKIDATTRLPSR